MTLLREVAESRDRETGELIIACRREKEKENDTNKLLITYKMGLVRTRICNALLFEH